MQNLLFGPTPPTADDQFGGPRPDDAHLSGVILRLNDDGSTPHDNPFFALGSLLGGEAGANLQRVYAYGLRNTFGIAFDPVSGSLWDQQNSDDAFEELNRVERGMNGGWIQIMGPRVADRPVQADRADAAAVGRPARRWASADPLAAVEHRRLASAGVAATVLAAGVEIQRSRAQLEVRGACGRDRLSPRFRAGRGVPQRPVHGSGDAANTLGGHLFHFDLTKNRRSIDVDDPRLKDRVADNLAKNDITESESLVFGTNFGVGTDVETGPNGNLFVVSLTNGAVYEIFRR